MGAVTKFDRSSMYNQLRHVAREIEYPKNRDIDPGRTHLNYSLTPERDISPKEYLKNRLSQLHITNEKEQNLMMGWVITKPKELDDIWEEEFFEACYEFLKDRYGGEQNVISAEVHKDESGEPHLHFCFIPVKKNTPNENMVKVIEYLAKHPEANNTQAGKALGVDRKTVRRYRKYSVNDIKSEKVTARDVVNPNDLRTFHDDLQNYLYMKGIPAKIKTGITKKNGGNKTVEEMKAERDYTYDEDIVI